MKGLEPSRRFRHTDLNHLLVARWFHRPLVEPISSTFVRLFRPVCDHDVTTGAGAGLVRGAALDRYGHLILGAEDEAFAKINDHMAGTSTTVDDVLRGVR